MNPVRVVIISRNHPWHGKAGEIRPNANGKFETFIRPTDTTDEPEKMIKVTLDDPAGHECFASRDELTLL